MNQTTHTKADGYSPLTLAFLGDGVYDLLVREALVNRANRPAGELNRQKVAMVNCKAQAQFSELLMPMLSEKELAVYKRGRNSHVHGIPAHANPGEYHAATGFEALLGWLYLQGRTGRIDELFLAVTED